MSHLISELNLKDEKGQTALMRAVLHHDITQVNALIQQGVDLNLQDNNGYSALMHAVFQTQLQIIRLLVEGKADLNLKDHFGRTALMIAVWNDYLGISSFLITPQANLLLKNKKGEDAFAIAMKRGFKTAAGLIKKELLRRKKEERQTKMKLDIISRAFSQQKNDYQNG